MIKKITALLCSGLAFSGVFAAELTFRASFEDGAGADFALGDAAPVYMRAADYVNCEGLDGNGLKIGPYMDVQVPGTTTRVDYLYSYAYRAENNMNSSRGALSFFIKPVDWDGANNIDNKMFFQADGKAESDFGFVIYKVRQMQSLYVYSWNGVDTKGMTIVDLSDWEQGEWHHVVCNWENDLMSFFVDGKHAADFSHNPFPADYEKFVIGHLGWMYETGSSVMDELEIYDEPLTVEEITAKYNEFLGDGEVILRKGALNVGSKAAPVADGRVSDGEYSLGSSGFIVTPSDDFSTNQSRYYLSHDNKNLYIAVETVVPADMQITPRDRDGQLWLEENIELHMTTAPGKQFQFIVTPGDAVYDSFNGDMTWNSSSFTSKSTVDGELWTVEMSMALDDLDIRNGELALNIARSFRSPRSNTCICKVVHLFGFSDRDSFFTVKLLEDSYPAIAVEKMSVEDDEFIIGFSKDSSCGDYNISIKYCKAGKSKVSTAVMDADGLFRIPLKDSTVISLDITAKDGTPVYSNDFLIGTGKEVLLKLQYLYTEFDTSDVIFLLSCSLPASNRGALKCIWRDLQGNIVEENTLPLEGSGINLKIPYYTGDFAEGFYTVEGIWLSPDGTEEHLFLEAWRRPELKEPEDHYALDKIKRQEPWIPLENTGSQISALTQKYDFSDTLLFEQVTALDSKLLAEPCYFMINGTKAVSAGDAVVENHGDYALVYQSAAADDLQIITESLVEFDGTVKVRMTLVPDAAGSVIKSARLVFPFAEQEIKYVNGDQAAGNSSGLSGLVGEEPWLANIFRTFMFWVGNEKVGFSWVSANARNWHCQDTSRSVELAAAGGGVRAATLNIVDTEFVLTEPRTIEFAVMATPPRNENLKIKRTRMVEWQMWVPQVSKFFDYLEPEFLTPYPGAEHIFFYSSFGTSPHSPDWNFYHKIWHHGALGYFDQDFPAENLEIRNRDHYISACMSSPTLLDFKISQLERFIVNSDFNVHNLYFDLVKTTGCSSGDHGCAWEDDFGRKWRSLDWEGRQFFIRRVRAALLAHNPDGMISLHTHNQRIPMVHTYGDVFVGGEDFCDEVGQTGNYYGVVNGDVLRAYSVPYGMGGKCVFIPQFERSLLFINPDKIFDMTDPVNIKAVNHLLIMLWANDIDFWYLDNPLSRPLWNLQAEFGWDENTLFYPSWNADGLFRIAEDSSGGKAIASVFKRDSRFLLILLNDSPRAADMKIELDFDRLLGKNPAMVRDCFVQGRQHSINGNTLSVNIDPYEFTVLWFE